MQSFVSGRVSSTVPPSKVRFALLYSLCTVHGTMPLELPPLLMSCGMRLRKSYIAQLWIRLILLQICSRVPCDQPCPNTLQCGHACPSGRLRCLFMTEHTH